MNEREAFWAGEFGNAYNRRSPGSDDANYRFFQHALNIGMNRRRPQLQIKPETIVELGCGTGSNLRVLHRLLPAADLAGVEINEEAAGQASGAPAAVYLDSILNWAPPREWDLAFTKGVLIHIAPEDLPAAYDTLWAASSRYILIAEYYNPTPMEIPYRGHAGRLWKRDFAGELMDRFDLKVLDYGFTWRRDEAPQDDITWFLFQKRGEHGKSIAAT